MKSRMNRPILGVLAALSVSHTAVIGYDTRGPDPSSVAENHFRVASAEDIVGGQAIDWVVCAVAGVGAVFFPFMGLISGPACFSAVVRTWG